MELGPTPYATLLFVTALVAGAIAVFAWRHRRATGAVELGVLMGAAGTWAFLAAIEVAATGPWILVRITDDGPGIPAHERRAITAGEETALEHASGIGLWIIRGSGGDVTFETSQSGSTVTVTHPCASSDPATKAGSTGIEAGTNGTERGGADG